MTKKPKSKTIRKIVTLSVMAPVTVEMVVEKSSEDDTWLPVQILRTDFRSTITPTFVRESLGEDGWDDLDERAIAMDDLKECLGNYSTFVLVKRAEAKS